MEDASRTPLRAMARSLLRWSTVKPWPLAAALLLVGVAGCATTHAGHVYDASAGLVGNVRIERIEMPTGALELSLANVRCAGDFADVPAEVLRLGDIEPDLFLPFTPESRAARAVLACADGRVVRCALMKRTVSGQEGGFGACKDGTGHGYSLFF
jgi:hypothetical protein